MKKLFQILAGPIAFALMMLIPFGGLDTTARGAIGLSYGCCYGGSCNLLLRQSLPCFPF